jgi:glycine cleavage system H protein
MWGVNPRDKQTRTVNGLLALGRHFFVSACAEEKDGAFGCWNHQPQNRLRISWAILGAGFIGPLPVIGLNGASHAKVPRLDGMSFTGDVRYTREHEWARLDGGEVVVGITSYAADELGDVVYVELPHEGEHVEEHGEFGTVESVKAVSPLYAPIAGEIVAVNTSLGGEPELVNSSPMDDGWMIRLRPDDVAAVEALMDHESYCKFVNELRA